MKTLDLVRDNAIMQNGRNTGGRAKGSSGGTRAANGSDSDVLVRRAYNRIDAEVRNSRRGLTAPGSSQAREMAAQNRAARYSGGRSPQQASSERWQAIDRASARTARTRRIGETRSTLPVRRANNSDRAGIRNAIYGNGAPTPGSTSARNLAAQNRSNRAQGRPVGRNMFEARNNAR